MEETKKEKEKKPFNVVLLGNIESEKAALLHKFIKKRFAIKQLQEIKMSEEDNDKLDNSNINCSTNNVEIHGETIKMKIWDNVSANKIFSSSNKSLKIAQGIILFYSVADRKSFNILKMSLSKMIDFDKYDIPMLMVGSDSDTPNRQVTYEEAKSLADSYGLRFYETSIKYGMNDIFEDIGEQVFYEEYGNNSNNKNKNINYYLPKCKSQKNINKNISIYSDTDFYKTDFNSNLKRGIDFRNNISNFNLIRERNKSKIDISKTNEEFNSDMDMDESLNSFRKKTNKNRNMNMNNIIKSPDIINNKLLTNNSPSSILLSYQGTTEATKNREEEIRERRIKKEKEMKSWWKKRERENIENQKKRKKIEKEELQKKIKEEKINQKEKEKKVMEENYIKIKNNYENKKRNNKLEKNKRLEKMSDKRNDNENLSISKEEKENLIRNKLNNKKNNAQNKNNKTNSSFNNTETNFYKYKKKNEEKSNKLRAYKLKNKSQNKKNKDSLENSSVISDEIIKQNELKNKLLEMYQKNNNVYRCLKCKLIPNIIINEFNQEIEIFCDKSFHDQSHHNITTYSNFQDLSLNHPIDGNNVFCHYCNKAINELTEGKTIYYCCLCDIYYCTEDEELHKNEKHKNKEEIKEKYLQMLNKKNNKIASSSHNTKAKTLIKQKSTPLLLKDTNNNKKSKNGNKIITNNIINDEKNDKNEKKKIKDDNKIQIFLMDSFCANHFHLFKYYCYNCHRNICDLCENQHLHHNKIKLEDILLEEDELIEKKNKLSKEKEELIKINDCFNALIEAIKRKFERLYSIKQKELDIKEKIIKDYETIKYNYHSIENVHNLKFNNNYFIDKSQNSDWFHRFNQIFRYLNSSLSNKNNDIFDLLNNRNENNNIKIISNNNMNKINKLIILKNEDIAVSNNNKIIIYDKSNLEEKLNIDVFKNNSRIDNFIEKEGGGLLCSGFEYIKSISLSLNNKSYYIEDIIYEKNNNLNSIIELNNNYLILLNNNCILELWEKNYKIKKYEIIDSYYLENNNDLTVNYDLENNDLKEKNNYIFKINHNSFIVNISAKDSIEMLKINDYNKIELKFELDNIKLVKGNNSLIKLLDEDYILLSCYEYKNNILYDENEYNNSMYFNYSIKLIDINNFNIIGNFNINHPFIDMRYYIDNIIIGLDSNGVIYKFELDKYQQNLFLLDKIYYKSNLRLPNDKINGINIAKNKKSVFLNINDKIIIISNFD